MSSSTLIRPRILVPCRLSVSSVLNKYGFSSKGVKKARDWKIPAILYSRFLSLDGRRRSPPFLPPPLFLSATDIARSERVRRIHNNRRIQSCSTYWEEWVKISSEPIAIDCDLHKETRRGIIVARFFFFYFNETHRADTSLSPFLLPPLYTTLRIVSFTLLLYFYYYPLLFIMFTLLVISLLAIVYYPCYYACFNYGNEKNVVRTATTTVRTYVYLYLCVCACLCVFYVTDCLRVVHTHTERWLRTMSSGVTRVAPPSPLRRSLW